MKYISRLDGQVYDFDASRIGEEEFQALDMRGRLDARRLIPEGSMPPILCININLTKEIRNFMRISFFSQQYDSAHADLGEQSLSGQVHPAQRKDLLFRSCSCLSDSVTLQRKYKP